MNDDELFKQFLEEYFENIKRELPTSYRAQQLNAGGVMAKAVYEFEERFLKQPFMKALKEMKREETIWCPHCGKKFKGT
jgi:hypothetical protein